MKLCVFCGSRPGEDPKWQELALCLGQQMIKHDIDLVYGGSDVGLMGVLSKSIHQMGGHVTGVIPKFLQYRESPSSDVHALHYVDTMHERKQKMYELSDAFLIFPGGLGTMDEFFEVYTWKVLGLHKKPIIILNIDDYYRPLIDMINHFNKKGFVGDADQELITLCDDFDGLFKILKP